MTREQRHTSASLVVRGAGAIMAAGGLGAICSALGALVIPRMLGTTGYAKYAFVISICHLLLALSQMGTGILTTRRFTPLYTSGRIEEAFGLYSALFWVRSIAAIAFAIATAFLVQYTNPFGLLPATAILAGLLLYTRNASQTLFLLQWGVLRLGRYGLVTPLSQAARLFLLPAGYLIGGLPYALGGLVLGQLLISSLGLRYAAQVWPSKRPTPDFARLFAAKRLMFLSWVSMSLLTACQCMGPILIAIGTEDTDKTAHYGLAISLVALLVGIAIRGTTSFSPIFGLLLDRQQTERLSSWASLALRGGFVGGLLLWGTFLLIGENAIRIAVGEPFLPAYGLICVLLLAFPFQWGSSLFLQISNAHEKPHLNIFPKVVQTAAFILLGIRLLMSHGPTGLAIAYVAAAALGCFSAAAIACFHLRLRIGFLRAMPAALCVLPYLLLARYDWPIWAEALVAVVGTLTALLIAHVTSTLTVQELKALKKALVDRTGPGRKPETEGMP